MSVGYRTIAFIVTTVSASYSAEKELIKTIDHVSNIAD